jgi:hypothetical protein
MNVEMVFKAKNLGKEELRGLLQKIREWELSTPRTELDGFTFTTEPQMSQEETMELFEGISPKYKNVVSFPLPENAVVCLGDRAVVVKGEMVGTCEELTLTIGAAPDELVKQVQEANEITLVRMAKG